MAKKYAPDSWDLESLLDSTRYTALARCVELVEDQITQFDERNETEFSTDFGDLIQAAFLMATVAQLEHHLKKICDVIAEVRNLDVQTTDLKGANGFESCLAYMKKVLRIPLPEDELKAARDIVAIRNAWVHRGGYLDELPKQLRAAGNCINLTKDGQISFSGPFVQEASSLCGSFVERVEMLVRKQSEVWAKRKKPRNRGR